MQRFNFKIRLDSVLSCFVGHPVSKHFLYFLTPGSISLGVLIHFTDIYVFRDSSIHFTDIYVFRNSLIHFIDIYVFRNSLIHFTDIYVLIHFIDIYVFRDCSLIHFTDIYVFRKSLIHFTDIYVFRNLINFTASLSFNSLYRYLCLNLLFRYL